MKYLFAAVVAVAAVLGGACAPARHSFEDEGAFDPVEPINRAVYGFNKKIDAAALRPAAKIYSGFPPLFRTAVENVLSNLGEPKNMVNHALQGRADDTAGSMARFVFNSTFGIGGMADVAQSMGVPREENDFGRTIRSYTGNGGAYIMLPFWGPSSLADAPGAAADIAVAPQTYAEKSVRAGTGAAKATIARAELLEDEYLLESALDEYSIVRDVREELRRQNVPALVWDIADR